MLPELSRSTIIELKLVPVFVWFILEANWEIGL